MTGSRRLPTALAVVALIGAGCSSAPSATSTGSSSHTQAVKFAECMRDNGVSAFPDPDASGALTADGVVNGSSIDPGSASWKKAIRACKDLEPSGFTGHERTAGEQEKALEFAQCIRDHGVPDFQDPAPDGPLVDVENGRSIPGLDAAMQKCRGYVSGANGGR
jgi:hypothetical protein